MNNWTKFGVAALAVAVAVGCGDDGSPSGDSLSQSEKTALANALASTEFGGLAAYVVQVVGSVGTLDAATASAAVNSALKEAISFSSTGAMAADYEGAVGIAIEFDYDIEGEVLSGWFYGVFGWNGINTSAGTVDEWVIVGGSGDTGSLPSSTSGDIGSANVFADYSMSNVDYFGTSGSASMSGSFSGNTNCSQTTQGITVVCSYGTGTMNGNFSFVAEALTGGGSYTQTPITFANLPAVKMTIALSQ
ncbi:MAG: hypothetical protein OEY20_14325 [Gemmatimonadota bacterium]|nr:hypothetical protein [Gemmatimonadota bacterium]MDH4351592.1 hypothetical protein [Gemmatimonadota bacterium]MDH5198414.1 hypothetical protein [Gemmatimonadota bacterium]